MTKKTMTMSPELKNELLVLASVQRLANVGKVKGDSIVPIDVGELTALLAYLGRVTGERDQLLLLQPIEISEDALQEEETA